MKKFLLLCGVAAISVASVANYVKAGAITEDFNVKIKLINYDTGLAKAQDLNFGTVLFPNSSFGTSLTLSTDGTVSGDFNHFGNQKNAIVYVENSSYSTDASLWDIEISGAKTLETADEKICGYVSNWEKEKFSYTGQGYTNVVGFKIGAIFTSPTQEEWEADWGEGGQISGDTDCSDTATATLIYTGGVVNP